MSDNKISKEEQAAIEAAQLRSDEPSLRDILKREHDEALKRPRNVALEKRGPSNTDLFLESLRMVKFDPDAKLAPKKPSPAKQRRRDEPDLER